MTPARQIASTISAISKLNLFQIYMSGLFTLTGYKDLNLIFLDIFSDHLLPILSNSKKKLSIFYNIMHGLDIS